MTTAQRVNRLHAKISTALRQSLSKAIHIGQLLTEQKAEMEHGDWGKWLKKNVRFSAATANNYMKLYVDREKLKSLNVRNLAQAYRVLYRETTANTESWAKRHAKAQQPKESAASPPKGRGQVVLQFRGPKLRKYNRIVAKLSEVFGTESPQETIFQSLEFTYDAKVKSNSSQYSPARRVGGVPEGKATGRKTLQRRSAVRRRAS